ncbi:glycoside hydrolase family 73 protein [Enterococcus hirae]|jgi:flagellum-specific peptidoglycan hydrolase FlgJ|nr:glycoside hydrolase family 73 protein [Enterococcaceae bacterium]MCI1918766.1 glycoside hydrolase family 73 protein [Enterococcaceae bacterium]MDM8214141.1 glycoside hydrolase family 73 protein [Enterococcus hirae]
MMNKKVQKRKKLPIWRQGPFVLLVILVGLGLIFGGVYHLTEEASETPDFDNYSSEQKAFIERLAPQAQELHEKYGVLPSIILGQAILESDWGRSSLASKYNNLFGIKTDSKENGVELSTQEYENGQYVTVTGNFQVFSSWEECLTQHTKLFVNGVDWNPKLYEKVLNAGNYQEAASELQKAGYATDPEYAAKIIQVIEQYELDRFDGE